MSEVIAASLYSILAYKQFHRNSHFFLIAGEPVSNSAIFAPWVLQNNQVALNTTFMHSVYDKLCEHLKKNTYFELNPGKY